ncbi:hypothetical protein [Azospirillum canadense]|uniref:hypothetical protein n=1 Tax=Azospirillum canadense TaxID=403962 RepID=UPI0022260250|nr:hypothetical protein [Azospirillum canadense]MCW2239344.1 hypothetical protein [Azospirillum canadense]
MTDHADLTPKERDLIRREFMRRLTSARSIHDGIMLKRWSTGPRKGEPKLQAAVQSLRNRGLVELADLDRHWPTARFTAAGYAALRRLAADRRALNAEDHAQMIGEITALDTPTATPDAA